MFCDLVGSTALAAVLDIEDWRNLLNSYLNEASKAVTGLGGHVVKMLGDGMMAVFGYPRAQENDAERAVRAALAIQRALAELNARNAARGAPELKARIGIESGQVVMEATGEVFGDAPNVAARVEAAAEPGSVLVTLNVQRQVAGLLSPRSKARANSRACPPRSSFSGSSARAAAATGWSAGADPIRRTTCAHEPGGTSNVRFVGRPLRLSDFDENSPNRRVSRSPLGQDRARSEFAVCRAVSYATLPILLRPLIRPTNAHVVWCE